MICVCPTEPMNENKTPLLQNSGVCIDLLSLRAQNEGREIAVRLRISSGENCEERKLIISSADYYELKPARGSITPELYDALESAAELYRAVQRGAYLLSFGSNSERTLVQKLMQKGFSREIAYRAAELLALRGAINEGEDLRREVEKCLRKLWGPVRIRAHVKSRGYGIEALEQLPSLLDAVDFNAQCQTLFRKKYSSPTTPEEKRRTVASLIRYGYPPNIVKAVLGG